MIYFCSACKKKCKVIYLDIGGLGAKCEECYLATE